MAVEYFYRIDLRIFEVRNLASAVRSIRARFTEPQMLRRVQEVVAKIHEVRPGHEFVAFRVGPAKFNIVWKDYTYVSSSRLGNGEGNSLGQAQRATAREGLRTPANEKGAVR
jgi:dsRNA-specific ribonuclease